MKRTQKLMDFEPKPETKSPKVSNSISKVNVEKLKTTIHLDSALYNTGIFPKKFLNKNVFKKCCR